MNLKEFDDALAAAMNFFPGIEIKREQKECLKSLAVERKDVLGVLPTGFGKSLMLLSAECWLSDTWRKQLSSGSLSEAEFLVVDEVHTVESWYKQRLYLLLSPSLCPNLKMFS